VKRLCGGPVYCARRADDHKRVLNADSPAHLAEYLEDEVSAPVDHGWVSGTSGTYSHPADPPPNSPRSGGSYPTVGEEAPILPLSGDALVRQYGDRWAIEWNPIGVWTAERTEGTTVHYLVDKRAWVLAAKIEAPERDE
jgi:hypothetical protein